MSQINETYSRTNTIEDNVDDELFTITTPIKVLLSIGYYLIALVSIFGNSLIIYVVIRNKRMHNVTNYFITNLAIVDIIISVFSTPFQVRL